MAAGGSVAEAADLATAAAVDTGLDQDEARCLGGEAAGVAVLEQGGSRDEAMAAAVEHVKRHGGSIQAQAAVAGTTASAGGADAKGIATTVYAVATGGG